MHSVTQLWLIWKSNLFEKLKVSPLLQDNVQQGYRPESYTRYPLFYQKYQKNVAPTRCGLTPPFPWTFIGNPGDGGKSYATAKSLLISPIRETPLNRFKYFDIKGFISSTSNSNFQVITLCNLHLQL